MHKQFLNTYKEAVSDTNELNEVFLIDIRQIHAWKLKTGILF